jgi:DNA-binding FadR family transcriptional regulator
LKINPRWLPVTSTQAAYGTRWACQRTPRSLRVDVRQVHAIARERRAERGGHDVVFATAGNVFLAAVLEPLGRLLVEGRHQTSAHADIRVHAIEHHEAIVAALRSRSPQAAAQAMRAHMDQTERVLRCMCS